MATMSMRRSGTRSPRSASAFAPLSSRRALVPAARVGPFRSRKRGSFATRGSRRVRATPRQAFHGWRGNSASTPRESGSDPSPASTLVSLLTAAVDDERTQRGKSDGGETSLTRASGNTRAPRARRVSTHPKLRTVSGQPVRVFALGGNRASWQTSEIPSEAYERGVNYFFCDSADDDRLGGYLDGLRDLCRDPKTRRKIFVAVGMEDFTNTDEVTAHVEKCLARLETEYIDAFFMEYVCRGDEAAAIESIEWMRGDGGLVVARGGRRGIDGPVRFVGCSTHDRCVAVNLLRSERGVGFREKQGYGVSESGSGSDEPVSIVPTLHASVAADETSGSTFSVSDASKACPLDFLMVRYNMAHAKAEWRVFPVAETRDVPIIAFASTRWNSLQKGHPRWGDEAPTTALCMRWASSHPAVHVVLSAAPTLEYLKDWTDEMSDDGEEEMREEELERWKAYGDFVYDESAPFETLY